MAGKRFDFKPFHQRADVFSVAALKKELGHIINHSDDWPELMDNLVIYVLDFARVEDVDEIVSHKDP